MIKPLLQHITNDRGFSLVELLVVLTLIGILSVFVMSSYFFASESIYTWRNNLKLENAIHLLLSGMAEDIYKSEHIIKIEDQSLSLKMIDGTERRYYLDDGILFRGSHSLLTANLEVASLNFSNLSDKSENGFWDDEESKLSDFKTILIRLSVTNGEDTLSSKRAVSLRKPSLWKSLGE